MSHGLTQHVSGASDKGGHRIGNLKRNELQHSTSGFCGNKGKPFDDHLAIQFIINMDIPDCTRRKMIYRKYRDITIHELLENLLSSQNLSGCEGSIDELVDAYNKGVLSIINHHAPSY